LTCRRRIDSSWRSTRISSSFAGRAPNEHDHDQLQQPADHDVRNSTGYPLKAGS
jgi:hypothetical protein